MNPRRSVSTKLLPTITKLQRQMTEPIKSTIKLPKLQKNKSTLVSLSNLSVLSQIERKIKPIKQEIQPIPLEMVEQIRQKAKLFGLLKLRILECGDKQLVKKILNEIKYTSMGAVAVEMWNNTDMFEKCQPSLMQEMKEKHEYSFTDQSISIMDFINNMCRFILADFKKKRWQKKEKDVSNQMDQINRSMMEVTKKATKIEPGETKQEIIASLVSLNQECSAKNPKYQKWKERAVDLLKSNQIKCDILRAEIFIDNL